MIDKNENLKVISALKDYIARAIEPYEGTRTLVLFQGMGNLLSHLVLEHQNAILCPGSHWFDEDGQLDLKKIFSERERIFRAIVSSEDVLVGVYEQIVPVRGSLSELYSGRIIVVKNNLFEEKMPTAAPSKYLAEFRKMIDDSDYSKEEANLISKFYVDAIEMDDWFLVSPILLDFGEMKGCRSQVLFPSHKVKLAVSSSGFRALPAPGPSFLKYCCLLCEGVAEAICFEVDASFESEGLCTEGRINAAYAILDDSEIDSEVKSISRFDDSEEGDSDRLLPVLKRYWGSDATFRELSFYRNPDYSKELMQISQGYVADQVVMQAELALNGSDSFRSVFVTAPTGAGKSLLFQIPALYLAEKYNAVTVVIEPLIALMEDQIKGLRERGVNNATALNSNLSYSDRLSEIEKIKNGEISIVYLSPELLLGSNIEDFIGDRALGLIVIDEAHTVALWGKNFRSDYWFLGSYLSKLRRSGRRFPIFCLTATAVYGGADDVVFDIIEELELESPKIFLGETRRDDIVFNIAQREKKDYPGLIDSVKYELVVDRIKASIGEGRHVLVYCPFVSHVNEIVDLCDQDPDIPKSSVMRYHGRLDKDYKRAASKLFESGKCRVMVCTTAYGMGIDIDDIEEVIHFAPTGNLSNYIQEIGRGARRKDLKAVATIDFFGSDSRFYAQLHSMSSLRQKQLKEVMKKVYALYSNNNPRRQNMLIAPSSFSYLFGNGEDAIDKTKTALLMIAKDLLSKYGFPVLIVKSKPSYTKNYICLPYPIEGEFKSKYGQYLRRVSIGAEKILETNIRNKWTPELKVRSIGDIYELDSARMWEERFSELTFKEFKWRLFSGEIVGDEAGYRPASRSRLEIFFRFPAETVRERFQKYIEAIQQILFSYKKTGTVFKPKDFNKAFSELVDEDRPLADFPEKVLDAFTMSAQKANKRGTRSAIRCLQKRTEGFEQTYRVAEKSYVSIDKKFLKLLNKCLPDNGENVFQTYLSMDAVTKEELDLAVLLELFGLATYETRGGDDPELFIRLNDPNKVNALANDPRYRNDILYEIGERHRASKDLITKFFFAKISDELRWDLIESYFLGESEKVTAFLDAAKHQSSDKSKEKRRRPNRDSGQFEISLVTQDSSMDSMEFEQIWNYGKDDSDDDAIRRYFDRLSELTTEGNFEKPIYDPELRVLSTGSRVSPLFAWPKAQILLFLEEDAADYASAQGSNWSCYIMGDSFNPEQFIEEIRL